MSSPITSPDPTTIRHIHLDPVGGIAGDMFLAAALDLWPELFTAVETAMRAAGLPEDWQVRLENGKNGGIAGRRLAIAPGAGPARPTGHYRDIRARLEAAPLTPPVADWAQRIFRLLAEAEAAVHGVAVDDVHFHEIADWDSVADIVGAAVVIAAFPKARWSTAPLPLGRGRITTAHGILPVPAPATARLLAGLPVFDDGIPGERVTPTGAAILAALHTVSAPDSGLAIAGSGHGLGTKTFDGAPNLLRLMAFTGVRDDSAEYTGIVRFEVDDQTPEDLAIGLAAIAGREDVRDVCQWAVHGKKGRIAMAVQILCLPESLRDVAEACFSETTTIGLRTRIDSRFVLARTEEEEWQGPRRIRRKRVKRPDGRTTVKAEADDLAASGADREGRERLRRQVEATGEEDG